MTTRTTITWVPRISSTLFLICLCLGLNLFTVAADAKLDYGHRPRVVSAAERQAITLAIHYLEKGAASWWEHLAADAPLRRLGQSAAAGEIAARCGPRQGVTWTLQTAPAQGASIGVSIIFTLEFPSGIDEILQLVLIEQQGWKIREIRSLADERQDLALAPLLPLRMALAQGHNHASPPINLARADPLNEVANLWRGQLVLVRQQFNQAEALINQGARRDRPLRNLLRARLALGRSDIDAAMDLYDSALSKIPDHDGIRFEMLKALATYGQLDLANFRYQKLAPIGSRLAAMYYLRAGMALYDGNRTMAEEHFTTGWKLEPMERSTVLSNSLYAYLAVQPHVLRAIKLSSPTEPIIKSTTPRRPLTALQGHQARLLGDLLTVELGGGRSTSRLIVPGGASLAPTTTEQEDASSAARRKERQALADLEAIDQGGSLSRIPPQLVKMAVTALAKQKKWKQLAGLTDRFENMDLVEPDVVYWRARALREVKRYTDARKLLIRLAQKNTADQRRDPTPFYQLAELVAASEEYDLAIRLLKKAHKLTPFPVGEFRIRQLRMEKELAESYKTYSTKHFNIRYPKTTSDQYPMDVGLILEAEFERLHKWIPVRDDVQIGIDLFPLDQFRANYSAQGLTILGLYDGRIRLPFAHLTSFHPDLVKTISHELAHAMISEHTGDQVPKWLHEGLAEHIQMVQDAVNPIPDMKKANGVLSFSLLESVLGGFSEAQLVLLAYNEASWVLHFIEAQYGVQGIHRLLKAFAAGHDTEQAIRQAFKLSVPAFETAAWDWCLKAPGTWPTELRHYEKELSPYLQRTQGMAKHRERPTARLERQPVVEVDNSALVAAMKTWHTGYSQRVQNIKIALGPIVASYRSTRLPGAGMQMACRRLADIASQLVADDSIFETPDGGWVGNHLRKAYQGFGRLGQACDMQRSATVRMELKEAEQELGRAAKLLGQFGLRP